MAKYQLRKAMEKDSHAIRGLIRAVNINPIGLDWRRFVIAVDEGDQLIGCGQVKHHRDGSLELASIAVLPEWRGNRIAQTIIEQLISTHPAPLYLTCRASLGAFYERFGFRRITHGTLPNYFLWVQRTAMLLLRLGVFQEELLVMMLK